MLKFLKSLLEKKKQKPAEEVKAEDIEQWFAAEIKNLDLGKLGKEYFQQLARLKEQLIEKSHNLEKEDIPKEHAKVESRVKNIVKGHRNNYARMIRIFMESIKVEDRSFQSLAELQALYKFNEKLDTRLDELALHTAKSYQAAQHLFFQPVEAIFKLLQELNRLVKDLKNKLKEKKIDQLEEIKLLISSLHYQEEAGNDLKAKLQEREQVLPSWEKELESKEAELNKMEQSDDYRAYKELLRRKEIVNEELKAVEQEIYSYFSKLSKPLRRYERIAVESDLLTRYNEDCIKTFWQDKEMKILKSLEGMKKNLHNLRFDSKQQENFKQLIEKSEILAPLREKGKVLQERMEKIEKLLKKANINERIEELGKRIDSLNNIIKTVKEEIPEIKREIKEADKEKIFQQITEKVKDIFNKEIILI